MSLFVLIGSGFLFFLLGTIIGYITGYDEGYNKKGR